MVGRVVVIQGSPSDDAYVAQIATALEPYGVRVERRTASAHRNAGDQNHLALVLGQYDPSDAFVTVAGLSDALSGRVAADFPGRVVASPPDAGQYGESKVFSSTKTPRGIELAGYARTPQEAADLAVGLLTNYDAVKTSTLIRQNQERAVQNMLHDARQQGFEEPVLPHTAFKRGKTRDVYDLGDGTLLIVGTDRASAFDKNLAERIPGKGEALTELAEYWFRLTQNIVPNHFIERVDKNSIRVKKAKRIDVECVIRGYIYGSLFGAYEQGKRDLYDLVLPEGLQRAQKFPQPIFTPTTKAEVGHDEELRKRQAIEMGLVRDEREWDTFAEATYRLYEFYTAHALERGIIVPDFKVEFGRINGELVQIDEPPNHDSARLWSVHFYKQGERQEGHALDKEFLRDYLRRGPRWDGEGEIPQLPELVIDQVSRRVRGATQVLTGGETDITRFGLITVGQVLEELKAA